ncbi:MAG: hypothetical protein V4700_01060 [Pseudomonadota bacterium]
MKRRTKTKILKKKLIEKEKAKVEEDQENLERETRGAVVIRRQPTFKPFTSLPGNQVFSISSTITLAGKGESSTSTSDTTLAIASWVIVGIIGAVLLPAALAIAYGAISKFECIVSPTASGCKGKLSTFITASSIATNRIVEIVRMPIDVGCSFFRKCVSNRNNVPLEEREQSQSLSPV